jgi:2-haloacid dehalogenase
MMDQPRKSEVLMVGDSLTSDIKGGNDSGIDTCWFNPSGLPLQDGMEPTFEIRRMDELLEIVRKRSLDNHRTRRV